LPDDVNVKTYRVVRGYTLLFVGVGLILYGLIATAPAAFTLGGTLVGGDPLLRAGDL